MNDVRWWRFGRSTTRAQRAAERRPRVLVINQRMDRTGAPMQLSTILAAVGRGADFRVALLAGSLGPMNEIMSGQVDELLHEPLFLRAVSWTERRLPARLRPPLRTLWNAGMRLRASAVDAVYVNSLISHRLAGPFLDRPMIVHVHELGTLADSFGQSAHELLANASRVLVPSAAAADWVTASGVPTELVHVMPGAVPLVSFDEPDPSEVQRVRRELGLSHEAPLVGTIGWVSRLKGSDRFLDVAQAVTERDPSAHFVWVGGSDPANEAAFRSEIDRRNLRGSVTVLPGAENLRAVYAAVDVVLIASREESLSLVALEAAAQATPVVYFPGAGGPDHLGHEGITVRPAGSDSRDVAATILRLLADESARIALGASAQKAVRRHHSPELAGDSFRRAVAAVLDRPTGDPW